MCHEMKREKITGLRKLSLEVINQLFTDIFSRVTKDLAEEGFQGAGRWSSGLNTT